MEAGKKIPLVIIAGPTAAGKTAVAVRLAKHLDGEVVSADSMQIYRYMDIGTAKPCAAEREGIPHHLVDIVEPEEEFSAAMFQKLARQAIKDIYERGKLPILAGGTGFFIDAVIYNYDFSFAGADKELRKFLQREAEEKGNAAVHERLRRVDPEAAERIHVNDLKRIIRALEIYQQTGRAGALLRKKNKEKYHCYDTLFFGLYYKRELLYRRIEERVDKMIEEGLVEEVKRLMNAGYHTGLVSMQGLGYKEIAGFLQGKYSLDEAIAILKRNTRRFAKRQLTWFKRYSSIKWIDMEKHNAIDYILSVTASFTAKYFPGKINKEK